jgi:TolB-like protein/class 3 adenylate cyclase
MLEHGRKIATILAADVVEYSRLMGMDEAGTLDALNVRRALFGQLVIEHEGHEFGSVGDSLMAHFPSAVNAVHCARATQQAIEKENEPLPPERRMALRVGVNLGDVVEKNGLLYGDGVNVAARLQALAAPGGIIISGAVHEQVKNKLSAGFVSLGARPLKNIVEPVLCYQVTELATAPVKRRLGSWLRRPASLGLALIALMVLGGGVFWYYGDVGNAPTETSPSATAPDVVPAASNDKSIAVLPFVNMSSDPEQEYFSDGLAEQVLNLLSKVPELRVIARTSSFAFKGKEDMDVATIARRLNVAHVLEGSVRKSGNQVRITTQLINAADSSHQWSETYDRELTDVFAVQDEIALAVVRHLKLALLNRNLPARSSTTSLEAYNFYLQGRHFSNQTTEKGFAKAAEFYAKALAADPDYAEAWAELAYVQFYMAGMGFSFKEHAVGFNKARASAQKALELDPDLARAYFVLGSIQFSFDWDWSKADASFKKAMALDPSDPDTLSYAGELAVMLGARDAGIDLCKKAVALDPVSTLPRYNLAAIYSSVDRLDEAESEIGTLLELSPEVLGGWSLLGMILLQKGQAAPALEMMLKEPSKVLQPFGLSIAYHALGQAETSDTALEELIVKYADIAAYQVAEAYAYRGENQKAFHWLDRAYRQRDTGVRRVGTDPLLENISNDPRYAAMLRKLKLPELRY